MNIDRKSKPSLKSMCNNIMHDYARGAAGLSSVVQIAYLLYAAAYKMAAQRFLLPGS